MPWPCGPRLNPRAAASAPAAASATLAPFARVQQGPLGAFACLRRGPCPTSWRQRTWCLLGCCGRCCPQRERFSSLGCCQPKTPMSAPKASKQQEHTSRPCSSGVPQLIQRVGLVAPVPCSTFLHADASGDSFIAVSHGPTGEAAICDTRGRAYRLASPNCACQWLHSLHSCYRICPAHDPRKQLEAR